LISLIVFSRNKFSKFNGKDMFRFEIFINFLI
jgi:hypothetical protein